VATTFDDKTEIILAGEVYGGGDIARISRGDSINTGFGDPRVNPPQGLGYSGVVADVVRVLQICEECPAVSTLWGGNTCIDGKIDSNQVAANCTV
jgi:hypothetical protein